MELDQIRATDPHVLFFPLPLQSHVTTSLKLAELLCLANFHITFLNSEFVHNRLLRYTNVQSHFANYPRFRFKTITDGLPEHHPRAGAQMIDMFDSLSCVTKPLFREMAVSAQSGLDSSWPPLTCIVADGVVNFATEIAKEIGVMAVSFRTISASAYWAYLCVPKMVESCELPFKESEMDMLVKSVSGMEGFLRRRDLPSFCRTSDVADKTLQYLIRQSQGNAGSDAVITNTFEQLEGLALSQIRNRIPNTYAVGPLHAHLSSRLASTEAPLPIASNSLCEEDRSCMAWLDLQPTKSVLYVSFGSIAVVTRNQLMEVWHGLVNSGKRFLWIVRSDLVVGEGVEGKVPAELLAGTKERGYMVGWAPQEEVLNHKAVGGFWTHSGWNSTLESIVAALPMMCWPYFADQLVNSRLVSEVFKLGLDMKDQCDRVIIEKMIRDLTEDGNDEFEKSANEMAKLARASVREGGSSYSDLDRLIKDIRRFSLERLS
ncbi:unnamed protein product [Malus baccata var. baccata]